jgi:hypothetical protein
MKIETLHAALAAALFTTLSASTLAFAADPPSDAAIKAQAAKIKEMTFASPEDAAKALYAAMKSEDLKKVYAVLGPGSGALIYTGDKVADQRTRDLFVAAYDKSTKWDTQGDKATLLVGPNDYPFPFPLIKAGNTWKFDSHAGAEEIINRRIGENEIGAIQSCLAVVDAQQEYVLKDRDKNGLREYAQKFVSSPGKRDGLYWPTADGQPQSPLGPLYAEAAKQGYAAGTSGAYHGYKFKMLTAQGKDAPGGATNYIVNGKMIGGFGVVAWPARWGVSGVMTFICNYDGIVYQKDLGANTADIASKMTVYNPDKSWSKTAP